MQPPEDENAEANEETSSGEPKPVYVCDRCGAPMHESHCKVVCPNCGARWDCSDLSIYTD